MNPVQVFIASLFIIALMYGAIAWRFNKNDHDCTGKGGTYLPMEGKCVTGIVILK